MDNQMDKVISELSKIEEAAVRIIQNAESEKKNLALDMDQKTKEYDIVLGKEIDQKLSVIKQDLQDKMHSDVDRIKNDTYQQISNLEKIYTDHHTEWATDILNKLIGE